MLCIPFGDERRQINKTPVSGPVGVGAETSALRLWLKAEMSNSEAQTYGPRT